MRNIDIVAIKLARNGLKIANSLGYAFLFESDFITKFMILAFHDFLIDPIIFKGFSRGQCEGEGLMSYLMQWSYSGHAYWSSAMYIPRW